MDPRMQARWEAVGLGDAWMHAPEPMMDDEPTISVRRSPRPQRSTGSVSDTVTLDRPAPATTGPRLVGGAFWLTLALTVTGMALTIGVDLGHNSEAASRTPTTAAA